MASELAVEAASIREQRQVLERKQASRLSLLSEFDSVRLQTLKRLMRSTQNIRSSHDQKSVASRRHINDTLTRTAKLIDNSDFKRRLDFAKDKYKDQIDAMYPSWASHVEKENIKYLRYLEKEETDILKRRNVAEDAFKKETIMRSKVAEKEYKVALLKSQEKGQNESRRQERAKLELSAFSNARASVQDILVVDIPKSSPVTESSPTYIPLTPDQSIDSPQSFEISYEWQVVPLGRTVSEFADQKIDPNLGRLAKLPEAWLMRATVRDQQIDIRVNRRMSIGDVINATLFKAKVSQESGWMLICNSVECDPFKTIDTFGDFLLEGEIVVAKEEKGSFWEQSFLDIQGILTLLESPNNYQELRGSKYGKIGGSAVDSISVELDSMDVYALCQALVTALHACHELLQVNVLIYSMIDQYHEACGDRRGDIWNLLCQHWRWLVQEKVLSRDEICNAFEKCQLCDGVILKQLVQNATEDDISLEYDNSTPVISRQLSQDSMLDYGDNFDASALVTDTLTSRMEKLSDSLSDKTIKETMKETRHGSFSDFLAANKTSEVIDEPEVTSEDEFDF